MGRRRDLGWLGVARLALKVKGTPKAGPKARRAKSEAEAIRQAVDAHGARGVKAGRKSSKVRTYAFKVAKKKPAKRKLSLDKTSAGLNDRNPREWESWEEAILMADASVVLDALTKQQVACPHKAIRDEKPIATLGEDQQHRVCPTCQVVLRWWGNYTLTIQAEWMLYRIEGYSMPEWGELFTKDKTLWLFIIEEAQFALTDEGSKDD